MGLCLYILRANEIMIIKVPMGNQLGLELE